MAYYEYYEPRLWCNQCDGRARSHRARRREVLEKVQNTSTKDILQVFHALHASTLYIRNCLATVRVILPPSAAIHTNGDVNSWITGRWRFGVGGVVAVWIPRVLSMGLHNNWHIRAMMRNDIGSRVRHSPIGKVRRVILVRRGKRVALTLMLLTGMRRRSWLHRHVVGRMVRRVLSWLVHRLNGRILSVDRKRVTHWAHERRSRRRIAGCGHPRN
jgi:hypothetical protein